jgi:hypothetical protein
MIPADFKLEVAAQNGKPKRLVSVARLADGRYLCDEVNVNSARARNKFCIQLAQKLEVNVLELQWLDDHLVESADQADDEADSLLDDVSPREVKNQATQLVELASHIDLFHNPDDEAFARFQINGHCELAGVRTKRFRIWLIRQFYLASGKVPSSQAIQDAIGVLEGKARYEGDERPVRKLLTPSVAFTTSLSVVTV